MADTQGFFFPDNTPEQAQLLRQQLLAKQLMDGGQSDQATGSYGGLANAGKMLAGALLSKRLGDKAKDLEATREGAYSKALGNFLSPFDYGGAPNADTGVPDNVNVSPQASAANAGQLGSSMGARLAATGNPDLIRQAAPQLMAQQLQANAPITPFQQTEIDARKAEMARQASLDARPVFRQPGEIPTDPNTGAPKLGPDGQPLPATGGAIHHLTADEIQQWGYQPGTQGFSRGDGLPPTITYKPPVPEGPKSAERRQQDNADAALRDKQRLDAQFAAVGGAGGTPPGLTGKPEIDPTAKGYSSQTVGNTGLTQAAIDMSALDHKTAGTEPPQGRPGLAGVQNAAVRNRMAEMDPGGNLAANKTQLKALSSSLAGQQKYLDTTQRAFNTANDTLGTLQDWMQKNNINPSQFPDFNTFSNYLKAKGIDPGAAGGYNAQIATLRTEYAQVLSRGGQVTDTARNEANKLIPSGLSPGQLATVAERIKADGDNVIRDSQNQVKQITNQIWHPSGGAPSTAPPTPGAPQGQAPAAPAPVTKRVKFDLRGNIIP